jgi:hypothetical protein
MEKLLHTADTALYMAKNAGRNQVQPNLAHPGQEGDNVVQTEQTMFWL